MLEGAQQAKIVGVEDSLERGIALRKAFLFMLGIAAAAVTGFAMEYSFRTGSFLLAPIIGAWTVWAGVYVISSLVFSPAYMFAKSFVEISIMSVPFWVRMQGWWPICIWIACMALAAISYWRASQTMNNVVKVNMGTIYLAARPALIVVLSIVCGMGYMVLRFPNPDYFIPKESVQSMLKSLNPAMQVFYPGFDATRNVNTMLETITDKMFGGSGQKTSSGSLPFALPSFIPVPSGFSLPQNVGNSVLDTLTAGAKAQARQQLLSQLGNIVGQKLTGNEAFPDVVYQWLHGMYDKVPEQTRNLVHKAVMALALLFFYVTFQFFGFLFDIAFGAVFGVLKALRIVRMGSVMVEKEKVII